MSSSVLHTIPIRTIAGNNKLYLDYVEDPLAGAGGIVQGFSREVSYWRDLADALARIEASDRGTIWEDVLTDVRRTSERAGASQNVLEKLERARDERVLFVICGQQAGLFGGPLLTVYKAFTAAVFADWLQSRLSTPAIPLFWIAADDTDFDEINSLNLLTPDLSPLSTSLSEKAHNPGLPIGDIAIEFLSEVWSRITTFVEAYPNSGCIRDWIAASLASAGDNGELFASILSSLTGGKLTFIDGRSGAVRRCAGPLFSDYLDQEEKIKHQVEERGRQMQLSGYHAQLFPGKDSGIFVLENGRRRTVPPDQLAGLRITIDNAIENCSPGVILRNLVQDYVFRPIAVVLGPAEIAYRAQIADAYQTFSILRPSVIPRMTATYIPPLLSSALPGIQPDGYDALIQAPARFAASFFDQSTPVGIRAAIEQYRKEVARAADDVRKAAAGKIPLKLHKRLAGRLAEIRRLVERLSEIEGEAGKMLALEKHPFLANIEAAIRPANKPQDRILSSMTPFMFSGGGAGSSLQEAAERHIAELLDGRPCHIVYSA
jgi:uncharacterized protein YllA (UPF0747 family)